MKIMLLFLLFLYCVNAFKNTLKDGVSLQIFKKTKNDLSVNYTKKDKDFLRRKQIGSSLKSTFDDIKQIISKQLSVEEDKIQTDSNFTKDLGADSLDLVELIMALEEKFSITISDQDALKINTVQDAIDFIEKNKKQDA
ncbi:acyl carrier protein [Plasmodium brasilianum]|uniref:Acyl carrier protein n=2 Tax=Plasmodium (Plasmodium) TaxID=418103 RepID=A0A1D3JJ54_PLAMA|nr:acyl carrier protein, putative [Plasmodium malariae]KAI4840449.1 acyl carrier protein [Plasmodium brasilianum]SBT86541.1 acyl carrier protein, putative [Plasmodium malariae]